MGFQTDCTTTGEDREAYHGAVAPPIYAASLFTAPSWREFEEAFTTFPPSRYVYTRGLNPTVRALEQKVALLEGVEECKFFGSGMAAISAVVMQVARSGDHVVAAKSIYAHTYKLLVNYLPDFGVETTFVDMTNLAEVRESLRENTRLLMLESPANPGMQITDLSAVAEIARERDIQTAIDNSLATPFNQRPAEFGIDYVMHTATKYLGGHSDVVAGCVAGSKARLLPLIERQHADLGGILGPFEAWLVLRGIRTLGLRMKTHNDSALALARTLQSHPRVARVLYPGLDAANHEEAFTRQMKGGSGLIGIVLDGGTLEAERFVDSLNLFSVAVSWGGFESLALPMWKTSPMPEAMRSEIGLEEGFVRLSVGLEDPEDLTADVESGLKKMKRS